MVLGQIVLMKHKSALCLNDIDQHYLSFHLRTHGGDTQEAHTGRAVTVCKIVSYHGKILRVMSTSRIKLNVNLPQVFYFVISAAQNGKFERFEGFCVDCY